MGRFVRLSHEIRFEAPGWPGNPRYTWEQTSSIADGQIANYGLLHLYNHFGSHLDAPNHFNDDGRKIAQVPLERFVYERPYLVDLQKDNRELVTRSDLEAHEDALLETDLLLVRTGWSTVRAQDPTRYSYEGPGVSPEACEYLIGHPNLKAIALDFLSLASYHRLEPEGILAHQILCGVGRVDGYVIIIQDIDLSLYPADTERVYAIPLFLEGADSSPCTVFAEVPS